MAQNRMSYVNRNYLVTGAQQGIGAAIARRLGAQGAGVAINYLDDRVAAEAVARDVREAGGRAITVAADVSSAASVDALVASVRERLGPIHGLVNNAGIFPRSALVDTTEDEWDAVMRVNLKGTFLATKAVARAMIEEGSGGAIVNISSGAAHASPMGAHYGASKGGILSFTRTAALELAEHSIRVNAISPGLIFTAQPRGYWSDEEIDALGQRMLLGRVGTVDDIVPAVVFLLGDGASVVTGFNMAVDGGGI
jgi:NAD(P)-dependent dehydrogenase (short-subunit alcohol dehydrogenase family)